MEAWRSLPGLRDPDKFEAWTRRLLVRACLKSGRRNRRMGRIEMPLTPADEPVISGFELDLDVHDELERGLARLSAEQRAAVVLVFYLDLPMSDAAQAMNVPIGTVKSRLNRAMKALRAALDSDGRETSMLAKGIAR